MERAGLSEFKGEGSSSLKLSCNEQEQFPLGELNDCMDGRNSPESNVVVESIIECTRNGDVLHSLSGIYAEILIVITSASILAEILPGSLPLFYFHEYLFLYLFSVGIMIFVITLCVMFHRRFSDNSKKNVGKLPSLPPETRREKRITSINTFFKVGVTVFGSIVLLTSLLEVVSIFISPNKCMSHVSAVQPLLRCIFILFQIYFLKNSKEVLDVLGCIRTLALMHLFATNIAAWIRLLLWEGMKDWEVAVHVKHNSSVIWDKNGLNFTVHALESDINAENISMHYPSHVVHYTSNCWWRVQKSEEIDVTSVQYCIQNSSIGLIWEKVDQFLYVCIQFIKLFQSVGLLAVFIYGSCNVIAGSSLQHKQSFLLAFEAIGMIMHGTAQYLLITQVSKKKVDVSNVNEKPGRQSVVFLIFCNAALWILECFFTWNHLRHKYLLTSGTVWIIATRFVLPFVVFYRFHSMITLIQAWMKAYTQS
ncbi:uncharacterized protein TNIN_405631 [Trichonephila inaurata madagascariensis]|uniref:Uncharacterized protein n=1 Tax=Trichonephila inaurata madagascariensis TaxID=2747483 RepID=A0A8X6Y3C8_9ARAC|nr:uncharacterized protein TNIN_405631 [Trichonephila inaurata madagascariensis]